MINDVGFIPLKGVKYLYDYNQIARDLVAGRRPEIETYRELVYTDLFFILNFVLQIPIANHKFVVDRCNEVQLGPKTNTLDLWAREHFKSTIITFAENIQDIMLDPNISIGILSYTRPAAKAFLRQIKFCFETNEFLKAVFPDVLYNDPVKEAPKWSEDEGIYVKRTGSAKEATVEAWGLLDGMPTSKHFRKIIWDDVETDDLVQTPEMLQKLKRKYWLSLNLGSEGGKSRVVGTTYSHVGLLQELRELKLEDGTPAFMVRVHPATDDGTPNGKPVFLSEESNNRKKLDTATYFPQQLLDPTPRGDTKLDPLGLVTVLSTEIPERLWKFMLIDPANERKDRVGDAWAFGVFGVSPFRDDKGASDVYLLDARIQVYKKNEEAYEDIIAMYLRGGRIIKLGVEKTGMSTAHDHISKALFAKQRVVTVESGSLVLLTPGGRDKVSRITGALSWPLANRKIKISAAVPRETRERLQNEIEKFPFWHDDGLDMTTMLYDLIGDYRFPAVDLERPKAMEDKWRRALRKARGEEDTGKRPWMSC